MNKQIYISPEALSTREEALELLAMIRVEQIELLEIDAYVIEKSDGWHAVRVHRRP